MNLRPDQLAAQLERPLAPLWLLHGNEPLLVLEAADAIRAAARRQGYEERETLVVGHGFKWDALALAAGNLSLFGGAKLIDLRIPTGKPGRDGGDALQRYIAHLPSQTLTLVTLPEVDWATRKTAWFKALADAATTLELHAPERERLPEWVARRLAAQKQSAPPEALAFIADHVEGNLLAAHQEIRKLGLLYPPGPLGFEQVEAAVLDVARFDVFKLGEAVLAGQVARALRMLDGLRAEGEAAVLVHWTLAEDIRALKRVQDAVREGKPLPLALRGERVWGLKEKLFERVVPLLSEHAAAHMLEAAQVCDGLVKGLRHAGWPLDPWDGLRKLVLLMLQHTTATAPPARTRVPVVQRLALEA